MTYEELTKEQEDYLLEEARENHCPEISNTERPVTQGSGGDLSPLIRDNFEEQRKFEVEE